jgi:hypothetical protein
MTTKHYRASTISSTNYILASTISLRWQSIHVKDYSARHQPIYNWEKAYELHRLNYGVIE